MADGRKRCTWGGCDARQHKGSHCEIHYPLIQAGVERRRFRHRKMGLCLSCSRPSRKWQLCEPHLLKLKERTEAKRRSRKCRRCGKAGLAHWRQYHAQCFRENQIERQIRWQNAHKRLYRSIHRKSSRDYQERHLLNGLCHYCPKPVVSGKRLCERHREIRRKRYVPVATRRMAEKKLSA